jgi:putative ABC transport system permease protein
LALGWEGSRLLATLVPPAVRQVQQIGLDGAAILFTVSLSLLAGLLFGLLPALHTARHDLMAALRSTGRDGASRGGAIRNGLVVAEIALAVVLLVGAGLLGRSFLHLQEVGVGFRTDSVMTASIQFPRTRYADAPQAVLALNELLARMRTNPSIRAAEATDQPPLFGNGDQDVDVTPVGATLPGGRPFDIWYRSVTPGYPEFMKMRLTAGRYLKAEDRTGATPVVMLNEEAARLMWPGANPVGREIMSGGQRATVVGVLATTKPDGPNQPAKLEMFMPIDQFPTRGVTVLIESKAGAPAGLSALRDALHLVDPAIPLSAVATMTERAGEVVALPRLYATLVGVFAAAALGLAILGVYGVMAYAVSQRQREIGLRMALGAGPGSIGGLVVGAGGRLTLIGIAIGLGGAALVTRFLRALLFEVGTLDATTFAGVAGLLTLMSLAACWLPARRAMRVDPLVAIREE